MKYYKITNEEEKHYGMHYQDGLNVDCIPFNPQGDCESGGIYFASRDILFFLSFGVWIREVTLPEGEDVYKNRGGYPDKYKAHQVILGPRRRVTREIMLELIKEGADPDVNNGKLLNNAIYANDTEWAQLLLENGAKGTQLVLNYAIENRQHELADLALKNGADIHEDCESALRKAAHEKDPKMYKLLLDRGANYKKALCIAEHGNHIRAMRFLRKHPPPPKPKAPPTTLDTVVRVLGLLCGAALLGYVAYTLITG